MGWRSSRIRSGEEVSAFSECLWVITVTVWRSGSATTLEHCFSHDNSDEFYQSIVGVIESSELDGCHIMASSNVAIIF